MPRTISRFLFAVLALLPLFVLKAQLKIVVEDDRGIGRMRSYQNGVFSAERSNGNIFNFYRQSYRVESDHSFKEGFIQVELKTEDTKKTPSRKRSKTYRPSYQADAILTSDRDLAKCVLLFAYPSNGQIGTFLAHVGNLKAGKPKRILIDLLSSGIDGPGKVHVLSQGIEVRCTDSNIAYQSLREQIYGQKENIAPNRLTTPNRYSFKLSPDGRKVLRIEDLFTKIKVDLIDLETPSIIRTESYYDDKLHLLEADWADSDNYLVNQGSTLFRVEAESGKRSEIAKLVERVIRPSDATPQDTITVVKRGAIDWRTYIWNGKAHYKLVGNRSHVHLNWKTGESTKIPISIPQKASRVIAAPDGSPNIALIYKSGGYVYHTWDEQTNTWIEIDSINKEDGLEFSFINRPVSTRIHATGRQSNLLYLSSNYNSDTSRLHIYNLETGRIKKTIANHSRYDIEPIPPNSSPLVIDPKTNELIGLSYKADIPRLALSLDAVKDAQELADATFPSPALNIPEDFSENYNKVLYRSSAPTQPDQFFIVDRESDSLIQLTSDLSENNPTRLFGKVTSQDGRSIDYYLTVPHGHENNEPLPLVVVAQANFSGRAKWHHDPIATFLAKHGYLALRVNSRGTRGYGREFLQAGVEDGLDGAFIDDLAIAANSLIESGAADPDRVYIMGALIGGYAAYLSIIDHPKLYKGGVSLYGYEDLLHSYNAPNSLNTLEVFSETEHTRTLALHVENLRNDKDYARRVSPLIRSDEITAPLLIIEDDKNTYHEKSSHVKKIEKSMKKKGIRCERVNFAYQRSRSGFSQDELYMLLKTVIPFLNSLATES
ncbi:alpha/beta hydrolase family protein [Pelagicoccus mobilis]|uniref:Prolyl oligopeptidase family serine peptidase n=1 Tax=Pelagicoccus mobilis TaxID=415221 RepID=A0A934RWJ5_9BACT|nr:prolyl oligopeptidase family serine peptidase [Pelagicoccus mobilis]MBK1875712.1 prolyl oligopeptidase family serine peptidase [Pelagicoccus mobilis]